VDRRTFLKVSGGAGLLALVPPVRLRSLLTSSAWARARAAGWFLTAHELETLRALTARLVPGPPDDPDPGAVEAGAAEAIDLYLSAFTFDPPLIHAGGPFSDRAGATHNDMADFVPPDALVELAWRIRLEGTQGRPERAFAGEVVGLQQRYRTGLAHLDELAPAGTTFASLSGPEQDAILARGDDPALSEFRDLVLSDTLDVVYGPPEYGGNRGLVGWSTYGWPGDVQPRGYSDEQVSEPDPPGQPVVPLGKVQAQLTLDPHLPDVAAAFARHGRGRRRAAFERGS